MTQPIWTYGTTIHVFTNKVLTTVEESNPVMMSTTFNIFMVLYAEIKD